MRVYILVLLLSAAFTYFLVPAVLRFALRIGAMTQVRERDVHTVPIPRLGGVAMFLGFTASLLIASNIPYLHRVLGNNSQVWAIWWGAALMCLVGFIDDIWELDWYTKLAGEVLAAGVMAWKGVQFITLPFMGLTVGSARFNIACTVLVVIVIVNAVNFMDGLDGLASGIVAIASIAFFIYSYILTRNATPGDYTSVACAVSAASAGMCIGFLPHNFHPARIFMGDSGALMLGMVIAGAGIQVTGQIDPAATSLGYKLPAYLPLLLSVGIIALPIVDFLWATFRRLRRGQSPFHADAGHLHHRLLRLGHSHVGTVLILHMWAAVFSFSCILLVVWPAKKVVWVALGSAAIASVVTFRMFGAGRRKARVTQGERIPSKDATDNVEVTLSSTRVDPIAPHSNSELATQGRLSATTNSLYDDVSPKSVGSPPISFHDDEKRGQS
ncbi:glycosyltransferase family 4 protein [Actinotignum urinale]|uniref:MraY family glycosyltransferase n=1 Tax=Actinotignum urinale TaxID=190146 RepID=A0ABU5GB88_9ACTO|nr:MraY family glycosyltransferase [Actinotignum urinale]MDY5129436.1 MraY family glycosyltransferase [Actinotignum urinale]MDY5132893.1 MraY family glycosyltransferase [Actinotignum urinale]MDY5161042.1 MraY family glycosyltransferase [Actinotignum urinale]WIK59392.1 MraY family glycosyltransferase [Actinotignum urinale]